MKNGSVVALHRLFKKDSPSYCVEVGYMKTRKEIEREFEIKKARIAFWEANNALPGLLDNLEAEA